MYRLVYAALTHPGRVPDQNEDNFYIGGFWKKDPGIQCFQVSGCAENGCLTAAVCDGMGGYASGEEASLLAVETLQQMCGEEPERQSFQDHLMEYVEKANRRICRRREEKKQPMGSTLALLVFAADTVTVLNLGDSRVYRMRKGRLEPLSTDHSVVGRMVRMGQITQEEARAHPMRHQITQHLGILPDEMILEPSILSEMKVKDGDRYLICSDGLTDMVEDQKLSQYLEKEEETDVLVKELVQSAVDAGGRDNITVLLIEAQQKESFWSDLSERIADKWKKKKVQIMKKKNHD